MRGRILLLLAVAFGCASPAAAQSPSGRIYFNVSFGFESKVPPFKSSGETRHLYPAGSFGLGVKVARKIGAEVVVQAERQHSVDWKWRYLFGQPYHDDRATHRDTLFVGQIRLLDACASRVCIEPLTGAGLVLHHAVDRIVADCGTDFKPKNPCEAVTPTIWDEEWDWRFAATGGVAVKFVVSPRVAVSPMAQLSYVRHPRSLVDSNFRGPSSGSRRVPLFGVTLTIKP